MSASPKPPAAAGRLNMDRCSNFMRQFRDSETRELTKLSANQFMEVWSHYDKDGNASLSFFLKSFRCFSRARPLSVSRINCAPRLAIPL